MVSVPIKPLVKLPIKPANANIYDTSADYKKEKVSYGDSYSPLYDKL